MTIISRQLEQGLIDLIKLEQFVIDNTVPVEFFEDNSKDLNFPVISVQCKRPIRLAEGADRWTSEGQVVVATDLHDDKDHSFLDDLAEVVTDLIENIDINAWSPGASFDIDGVSTMDADEPGVQRGDNHYFQEVQYKIFLRKNL